MKTKVNFKTPISYYGGKQSMLKHILPLIPQHEIYVEPFCGGGAVFWAKEKSNAEIINDANSMVSNFYKQLKTNFLELKKIIDATPYSRDIYKSAMVVYDNPFIFEPIVKAWAFWVCTIQGFSNMVGSWRASQPREKEARLNFNKKALLSPAHSERLELVQIENTDAVHLIRRMNSSDTFYYIDPPYVDSCQGHYGGYTQQHFDTLLNVLSVLKGKFLLSSYPNATLSAFASAHGWTVEEIDMCNSASNSKRRKIEVLTRNY